MGLFSKLFGSSDGDSEGQPPTTRAEEEASEANTAARNAAPRDAEDSASKAPVANDQANAPPNLPPASAAGAPTEAKQRAAGRARAAAGPGKVSEAIRRRRTNTKPGVAPPPLSPYPAATPSRSTLPVGGSPEPGAASKGLDAVSLRSLQAFYVDLHLGPVTSRWRGPIVSAGRKLGDQLQASGEKERALKLAELSSLVEAWPGSSTSISIRERDQALARCAALELESGQPLLDTDCLVRCERLMLEQVLQRAGVGPLPLERLREADLLSFGTLIAAQQSTLATRARVDVALAARIKLSLREFLDTRSDELRSLVEERPTRHLTRLANRLASLDRKYQAACDADDPVAKRAARHERSLEVTALKQTLAQLGKPDLASDVDRLSTSAKADSVRRWLAEGQL